MNNIFCVFVLVRTAGSHFQNTSIFTLFVFYAASHRTKTITWQLSAEQGRSFIRRWTPRQQCFPGNTDPVKWAGRTFSRHWIGREVNQDFVTWRWWLMANDSPPIGAFWQPRPPILVRCSRGMASRRVAQKRPRSKCTVSHPMRCGPSWIWFIRGCCVSTLKIWIPFWVRRTIFWWKKLSNSALNTCVQYCVPGPRSQPYMLYRY